MYDFRLSMAVRVRKTMISRRDLILVASGAGILTAAGCASHPPSAARADKRKPLYQASAPEVRDFYRVNRYPAKS